MSELLVSTGSGDVMPLSGGMLNDIPRTGNDIRRILLKGTVTSGQRFSGNFVECRIENANFINIDLARVDWKDCRVIGSSFENCELSNASFLSNSFESCRFVGCRFADTGISDSAFKNCVFLECDLAHVIIKSTHIEDSTFDSCHTSNKVVESSLLIDTNWLSMNIEVHLITGNFGLLRSHCKECTLVTRDTNGQLIPRSWSDLPNIVQLNEPSPVEYLRFKHFTTENLEADAEALGAALDLRNWGKDAVVQASLATQLSSLSQFLLTLFTRDRLPIYPLLILHSHNFEMLTWLGRQDGVTNLYQVCAGIHWMLAREVEAFTQLVDALRLALSNMRTVHFAANGPVDPAYFRNWLDDEGLSDVIVVSVRPRNSPVDLALGFENQSALVAILALFLACRTKVELTRLPQRSATGDNGVKPGEASQLISVSAGFLTEGAAEYELSIRTLLPHSLLLDLRLTLSVSIFQRAKGILVYMLTSTKDENLKEQQSPPAKSPQKSSHSRKK